MFAGSLFSDDDGMSDDVGPNERQDVTNESVTGRRRIDGRQCLR